MFSRKLYHVIRTIPKKQFTFTFDIRDKPYEIIIEWDGSVSSLVKTHDKFCSWFINNWTIPWKNNKLHFKISDDD